MHYLSHFLIWFAGILSPVLKWTVAILNGPFISAFLSALAGATAGVLGAQAIAERSNKKTELLRDFRNTNAAIILAFTTCNNMLAAKKQLITPLVENFSRGRHEALEGMKKAAAGLGPVYFHYQAELTKIPPPELPVEAIKTLLYSNVMLGGRALALVAMVDQALAELKGAIAMRNEVIDDFARQGYDKMELHRRYFGLTDDQGHTNQVYADSLDAVRSYANDVAFFSALLTEDLMEHGDKVRAQLVARFRVDAPRTSSADFSQAREAGLIPPESEYASWLSGFSKHPGNK